MKPDVTQFPGPADFPVRSFRLGIAAMVVLIAASMLLNWIVGENIRKATESQIEVITAAQRLHHYGTVLEMSVKAVVAHGDGEAAAKYRSIQPELRSTLSELRREVSATPQAPLAGEVDRADLALIAMEYEALDLVGAGRIDAARKLIHSPRYDYLAKVYYDGIAGIERSAQAFVSRTQARLDLYLWAIIALSGASLVLALLGWIAVIRPVRRWGNQLDKACAEAESAAADLREKQAQLERMNERLFRQARIDPLTGLATRLSFSEDAESIWTSVDPSPYVYCAAMCDIDLFKQYNDNCGHPAGDRALRLVAEALGAGLLEDDRVYRLGGEEFLVVMKSASVSAAMARADRARSAIADLQIDHPHSPFGIVTISMGVAQFEPAAGMTVERWLRDADQALYVAKNHGRNCVRLSAAQSGLPRSCGGEGSLGKPATVAPRAACS